LRNARSHARYIHGTVFGARLQGGFDPLERERHREKSLYVGFGEVTNHCEQVNADRKRQMMNDRRGIH
jgi:hypothetical protein